MLAIQQVPYILQQQVYLLTNLFNGNRLDNPINTEMGRLIKKNNAQIPTFSQSLFHIDILEMHLER